MFGDASIGILIFVLLAVLVAVKQVATGSILDRPEGSLLVQAVNVFNLLFLLVVNPLAGVLLLSGRLAFVDPSHFVIRQSSLLATVQVFGLAAYLFGFTVMAWALLALGRTYQLGGLAPRPDDQLVTNGPYRVIRHPMYAAVLSISFGLACLTRSFVVLAVFGIYLVLIHLIVPIEENRLSSAYGGRYAVYQRATRRLVPFVY